MKVSWSWLGDYVALDRDPVDVANLLTSAGLEVESLVRLGEGLAGVVVGEVRARAAHPQVPKLTRVVVWDGQATHEVVSGAGNIPPPGGKVVWAQPGARLGDREIEAKTIAEVRSYGMLCSEVELGIGTDGGGVLVLGGEDAAAEPGAPVADALLLRDQVLEIGVTTNRPDCLGHLGVAREVAALTGASLRRPEATLDAVTGGSRDVAAAISVLVEDEEGCPRYVARLIEGLTVGSSPRWMRRRLEAIGVRSISNIVDVTNYVMFELGQPLHAFDCDGIAEGRIVVRRARPGENLTTLDGQLRVLCGGDAGDLVICDARGPVALAGIMGGAESEIGASARCVLLESAYFEPKTIRRAARRLGLHSESSHRFERGTDPNGVDFASSRAARLLAELAGGKVARGVVDVYPRPIRPRSIELRPRVAACVLGFALPDADIVRTLRSLELEVAEERAGVLRVVCPTFRPDLEREVDLFDELTRTHMDLVPSTLPRTQTVPGGLDDSQGLMETVRDALCACGLAEAITFGFTSVQRTRALRFPEDHPITHALPIKNPLREEHAVMRTSLVPNLMAAVAHNLAHGITDVRLFEVGPVFHANGSNAKPGLPTEPRRAAGVICGSRPGWLKPAGPVDFYCLKGVVEHLFSALRIPCEYVPVRSDSGFVHPGVGASILVAGAHVGVLGEVHPETRERSGVEQRCFAFEIDLDGIPSDLVAFRPRYCPMPRYPSIVRDVSFWVDDFVPSSRVTQVINERRPAILEDTRILDDYREPSGQLKRKGMLWSLTYRAWDRTLTDAEVDGVHEELVCRILSSLGAERR